MKKWYQHSPVIGLAPMDGVTDASFRAIVDDVGKPSVLFTEFTSAEALARNITAVLPAFITHKTPTPIVAQLFGAEPSAFYPATVIVCALGFDGVDINMGCPDKHITKKGGGAGLIKDPTRTVEIIKQVQRAVHDWQNGITLSEVGISENMQHAIQKIARPNSVRKDIPVSVKTRIGFESITTIPWITTLLEQHISALTIHGRTFKELYSGLAHWDEIARAGEIGKNYGIPIIGNGDVTSYTVALEKISANGVAGVLIGRASFGNPWIFSDRQPSPDERIETVLRHAQLFLDLTPQLPFISLRKHFAWYARAFTYAAEVRNQLVRVESYDQLTEICKKWRSLI